MGDASGRVRKAAAPDARERVLSTAYDLFCRHGVRSVGELLLERTLGRAIVDGTL